MPSYLTPARYRTMAMGVDLSSTSDAKLAALIASASAEVNRFCSAPVGHDYRGASVTAEEHTWDTGNVYVRPSGRLWPKHAAGVMQITACPQIDIYTTKTNYIRFDADQIFVASRYGWVEPVAAPMTTALFTSVPPWLITEPYAYVDYTYGFKNLTVSDELMIDTGDHLTYYAQNQFWTSTDTVTVTLNGTISAPTIDRDEGTVTFSTPNSPGDAVLVSYGYKMPEEIRIATSIVVTDMLGYSNINASGLGGLSGIRVEEIELRQSSRAGFNNYDMHPAARVLLTGFTYVSIA